MNSNFFKLPKDAKLYVISQFFLSGYYTWPFWYGFATGRITISQFGVYMFLVYIFGTIAEVPTGAFADRYGRVKSAVIGSIFSALVPLIVYWGGNFFFYIIAALVYGISGAFVSGSIESSIKDHEDISNESFRNVMIQGSLLFQLGLIVSSVMGGLMFGLSEWLPFIAQAISFILAAIIISNMTSIGEVVLSKEAQRAPVLNSIKIYTSDMKDGFLHLFRIKLLRPIIVFGSFTGVLMWMGIEYVNEAGMINYGIQPESRGILLAGAKTLSLLTLNFIILRRIKTDTSKLIYVLVSTTLAFALYSVGIRNIFILGFFIFNLVSATQSNFIKPIIHDHLLSKWRSTAISAYSVIGNILQAIAALLVSIMLESKGVVFVQRSLLVVFLSVAIPALLVHIRRLAKLDDNSLH